MTKSKMAQKTDWDRCLPMPQEHNILACEYDFSPEEYKQLQQGFIPEEMEDKWFIYFENDKLYFHRSWTGNCIYIVEFQSNEKGGQITKVIVNRDKTQYKETDDRWDLELVIYLINLMLLGKDTSYPTKNDIDPATSPLQQWSLIGRAMLKDDDQSPGDNQ